MQMAHRDMLPRGPQPGVRGRMGPGKPAAPQEASELSLGRRAGTQ